MPTKSKKRSLPSILSARKKQKASKKPVSYVQDIALLPKDWARDRSHICIPRKDRRKFLSDSGLIGKVVFSSDMSGSDMVKEISKVFARPLKLSQDQSFSFKYLQRAGEGSRSLCCPTVKENFEWTGRMVSTLAKSGSCIYLLAEDDIPSLYDFVSYCL